MLDNVWASCLIQLGHLLLRQPYSIACKFHINTSFPIFALIYYYLIVFVYICHHIHCIFIFLLRECSLPDIESWKSSQEFAVDVEGGEDEVAGEYDAGLRGAGGVEQCERDGVGGGVLLVVGHEFEQTGIVVATD